MVAVGASITALGASLIRDRTKGRASDHARARLVRATSSVRCVPPDRRIRGRALPSPAWLSLDGNVSRLRIGSSEG
jgi:hypothetical protein